jgi:hypothetical protein
VTRGSAAWSRLQRMAFCPFTRVCFKSIVGVVVLVALFAAGINLFMRQGSLHFEGLSQEVSKALTDRLQTGWTAHVGDASIAWGERGWGLEARFVKIMNPGGHTVVSAPEAFVNVDGWGMLIGRFRPRAIGFSRLDLRLDVGADGLLKWGYLPSSSGPSSSGSESLVPDTKEAPQGRSHRCAR